jgi:hypothetical protein
MQMLTKLAYDPCMIFVSRLYAITIKPLHQMECVGAERNNVQVEGDLDFDGHHLAVLRRRRAENRKVRAAEVQR